MTVTRQLGQAVQTAWLRTVKTTPVALPLGSGGPPHFLILELERFTTEPLARERFLHKCRRRSRASWKRQRPWQAMSAPSGRSTLKVPHGGTIAGCVDAIEWPTATAYRVAYFGRQAHRSAEARAR